MRVGRLAAMLLAAGLPAGALAQATSPAAGLPVVRPGAGTPSTGVERPQGAVMAPPVYEPRGEIVRMPAATPRAPVSSTGKGSPSASTNADGLPVVHE